MDSNENQLNNRSRHTLSGDRLRETNFTPHKREPRRRTCEVKHLIKNNPLLGPRYFWEALPSAARNSPQHPCPANRLPEQIRGTVGRGGGPWWGGAAWRHAGGCEVECDTGVKTTCHSRDCSDRPVSTAGAKSKTEVAFHYVRALAWLAQRLGWGWGRGRRRGGDGSRSLWRCQQVRTAPAPDWRNKHVIQVVRLSPRCSVEKKLSIKRSSLPFLSLSLFAGSFL